MEAFSLVLAAASDESPVVRKMAISLMDANVRV